MQTAGAQAPILVRLAREGAKSTCCDTLIRGSCCRCAIAGFLSSFVLPEGAFSLQTSFDHSFTSPNTTGNLLEMVASGPALLLLAPPSTSLSFAPPFEGLD
jgi:hypothetical protein